MHCACVRVIGGGVEREGMWDDLAGEGDGVLEFVGDVSEPSREGNHRRSEISFAVASLLDPLFSP